MNAPESGLFVSQNSSLRVDIGGHGALCAACVCDVSGRRSPMITCHNKPLLRSYIFFMSPQQHLNLEDISRIWSKYNQSVARNRKTATSEGRGEDLVDTHIHKKPGWLFFLYVQIICCWDQSFAVPVPA